MGVVTFDLAAWRARFPEFATVSDTAVRAYFSDTALYLDNTDASPVTDLARRAALLGLLTAHLAALYSGVGGEKPSAVVGRVTQVTQGSVSVSVDAGPVGGSQAWFMTTKYGAAYWQATAPYRRFRYIQPPRSAAPYPRPWR